jgi:heat shock protein HspQ
MENIIIGGLVFIIMFQWILINVYQKLYKDSEDNNKEITRKYNRLRNNPFYDLITKDKEN